LSFESVNQARGSEGIETFARAEGTNTLETGGAWLFFVQDRPFFGKRRGRGGIGGTKGNSTGDVQCGRQVHHATVICGTCGGAFEEEHQFSEGSSSGKIEDAIRVEAVGTGLTDGDFIFAAQEKDASAMDGKPVSGDFAEIGSGPAFGIAISGTWGNGEDRTAGERGEIVFAGKLIVRHFNGEMRHGNTVPWICAEERGDRNVFLSLMRVIQDMVASFRETNAFFEEERPPARRRAKQGMNARSAEDDGIAERIIEKDTCAEMTMIQGGKFVFCGEGMRIFQGDDLVDDVEGFHNGCKTFRADDHHAAKFGEDFFQLHHGREGHDEVAKPVRCADNQPVFPVFGANHRGLFSEVSSRTTAAAMFRS